LGGETVAGGKLKETGTIHWLSPNTGATNESGFTALPGGYRLFDGAYFNVGNYGNWLSSTAYSTSSAWVRYVGYNDSNVGRGSDYNGSGFSVRCLQDK
jgi:uncharacterized protein (TIGR02145 family)